MARIKTSVIISDIRGSISGSTFQKTNAGLVLKNISKKVNKLSDSSLVVRNIMANNQIHWRSLTESQREIWISYANYTKTKQKNNKDFSINAQQLFLKINNLRRLYGLSLMVVPEFSKCVLTPVDIVGTLSGSDLIITSNRFVNADLEFLVVYATIPVTTTLNNPGSRFKAIIFNTTSGLTWNIGNEYLNTLFAVLKPNDQIFLRYTVVDKLTGISMPLSTVKVTL